MHQMLNLRNSFLTIEIQAYDQLKTMCFLKFSIKIQAPQILFKNVYSFYLNKHKFHEVF